MEKINEIIATVFKIDPKQVEKNLGMGDVGNWDSITHMDLIVSIEEEFKIELSGDDIADMTTFDAIRQIVANYIS